MPTTAASSTIGSPQRFCPTSSSSRATTARNRARARLTGSRRASARRCRMNGSSLPWRTLRKSSSLPKVWPMPTPTAIGTGPATADTWEPITYASALATGTIAETTPKPTDVSSATSSDQPKSGTG